MAEQVLLFDNPHTKSNRGGCRPGAGRPPAGTVKITLSVHPDVAEVLRLVAEAEGMSQGEVLHKYLEGGLGVGFIVADYARTDHGPRIAELGLGLHERRYVRDGAWRRLGNWLGEDRRCHRG